MVIPVGQPVELRLVSADVNHSFWVPDFLSKRDLIPGVDNEISVTPTEIGSYVGRCAEFCGLDHWRMNYTVGSCRPTTTSRGSATSRGPDETAGGGG